MVVYEVALSICIVITLLLIFLATVVLVLVCTYRPEEGEDPVDYLIRVYDNISSPETHL